MRNKILTEVFTSKSFNECVGKMRPACLRDDLKSEVSLVLCEMPEARLIEIYNSGGIYYYVARIVINMVKNSSNKFFRNHLKFDLLTTEMPVNFDIEVEDTRLRDEQSALNLIDALYWYDAEIVRLYLKLGNYRAVSKATGIPMPSIYATVQQSAKKIKEKINE